MQYRCKPIPDPNAKPYYFSDINIEKTPPLAYWTSVTRAIGDLLYEQRILLPFNDVTRELEDLEVKNDEGIYYDSDVLLRTLLEELNCQLVPAEKTNAWYLAANENGYQFLVGHDTTMSAGTEVVPFTLQRISQQFSAFDLLPQPGLEEVTIYSSQESVDVTKSIMERIRLNPIAGFPGPLYFRAESFEVMELAR